MDLTPLETSVLAQVHMASWPQRSQGIASLTSPAPRTPELLAGFPWQEPPLASGSEEVNFGCLSWGPRPLTVRVAVLGPQSTRVAQIRAPSVVGQGWTESWGLTTSSGPRPTSLGMPCSW